MWNFDNRPIIGNRLPARTHSRRPAALALLTLSAAALLPLDAPALGLASADDPVIDVDNTVAGYLAVPFDGQELSWLTVSEIARDPVLDWGYVRNAAGDIVPEEVWLIVPRAGRFVYFHLLAEPNVATGPTTYSGYTVKIKVVIEHTATNFGGGTEVPQIGNAEDAFAAVETRVVVNDRFAEQQWMVNIDSGEHVDRMVELGISTAWSNVPLFSSAGRRALVQQYSASGELIQEDVASYDAASGAGSCEAVGEAAANVVSAMSFLPWQYSDRVLTQSKYVSFAVAGAYTPFVNVGIDMQRSINESLGESISWMTGGLYGLMAENACEVANGIDHTLSLDEFELGLPDGVEVTTVFVCDEYGVQETGESWDIEIVDGIEEHDVTVHTELVCTEWHIEVVES